MERMFPALMKPGKMGRMELDNRIVAAPMGSLNGDTNGFVTENAIRYYTELARGGMGLIVVESAYTDTILSKAEDNELGIWSNEHVTNWARLVSCVQDQGVRVVLQLSHIGHQISLADKCESLGPSTMVEMMGGVQPFPIRGVTKQEIEQIEDDFAQCAWRAKVAGFDGVEIHGAIGHLIAMFCTPFYNKRTDEYGGTTENRIRFMVEIVEKVHEKCGKGFPVIARITGCDFDSEDDGGMTLEEGIGQARYLEKAGVCAMHIVGGSQRNIRVINCQYDPRGDFVDIAAAMKQADIRVPIIIDGGFTTPDIAEKVLEQGKADYIGLGRPLLADPEYAKKVRQNRPEDIIPCIRCVMGCVGPMATFNAAYGMRCSVNPLCNMTGYRKVEPAEHKKRVAVVGGGPAGMEAARVATLRGHDVTIYEKRKLGGVMNEAAFDLELKGDVQRLIDYYRIQMSKLGVAVRYEEATEDELLAQGYDAIVVATGAEPIGSRIPGSDDPKVIPLFEYAGLRDTSMLGDRVLIVGSCFPNVEMAHALAKQGKKVVLSTRKGKKSFLMELGQDNSGPMQSRLLSLIMDEGIELRMGKDLKQVTPTGAVLADIDTRETVEVPCDNIILCRGYRGRGPRLYDSLRDKMDEVYKAGDCRIKSRCVEPRTIGDAILEGWQVGNRI